MGKRGPKPTPTGVLKLRGSWRANRPDEPVPPDVTIEPPSWLTDAGREVWDQMAPVCIAMNTLTAADAGRFARYCNAQGAYQRNPEGYDVGQFASLTASLAKYEAQFGLGASDRANMKVGKSAQEKPTKGRFFKQGG
jgi:hypothetical protein